MGLYSKNGFQLTWFNEGRGRKIIFLPGWAEVPIAWRVSAENRLQNCEKIFMTLGGHYPAEFPPEANYLNLEEFMYPHCEVLSDLAGQEKITIIGHSTGALVAWFFMNLIPEKVDKVILVGSFIEGPLLGAGRLINLLKNLHLSFIADFALAFSQNSHSIFLDSVFAVNPETKEEFLNRPDVQSILPPFYEAYKKISPKALRIVLQVLDEFRISQMDLRPNLDLNFIHGEKDGVIPISQVQDFCDSYPSAKLIRIPDCGHSPHWEKKEIFWQYVEKILSET